MSLQPDEFKEEDTSLSMAKDTKVHGKNRKSKLTSRNKEVSNENILWNRFTFKQ